MVSWYKSESVDRLEGMLERGKLGIVDGEFEVLDDVLVRVCTWESVRWLVDRKFESFGCGVWYW